MPNLYSKQVFFLLDRYRTRLPGDMVLWFVHLKWMVYP
jgi:hypothetical protein